MTDGFEDGMQEGSGAEEKDGQMRGCELMKRYYLHAYAINADGSHDSFTTDGFGTLGHACERAATYLLGEIAGTDDDSSMLPEVVRFALSEWDELNEIDHVALDASDAIDRVAARIEHAVAHGGFVLEYRSLGMRIDPAR